MENNLSDIGQIGLNLQRAIDLEHEAESKLSEARTEREFWSDLESHIKNDQPAAALGVLRQFEDLGDVIRRVDRTTLEIIERLKAELSDTV